MVALITGRRAAEARALLDVDGVRYEGLYGLEDLIEAPPADLRQTVEAAAEVVPQAWVEEKGLSLSVHYRQASDPVTARSTLVERLEQIARDRGLRLLEGKMVLELVPEGRPLKGGAVERLVSELGLRAALYAGDDVADLEAFAALDRFAAQGITTLRVAVRGDETPDELVAAADEVVEGPAGLVELLRSL